MGESSVNKSDVCEVCEIDEAKYTCPACETRSCSLKCVTAHKKDSDCDGIRPRTSYVSLEKFTDLHFLNDYRLLEEIGRSVEKYGKDKTKRYSRFEQPLPVHLIRLRNAVMQRGTRFFLLPGHFSRHRNNTTFYDWKTKKISWKLQITFLNAEMLTFHEDRCPENTRLQDIISKYVSSSNPALKSYRKAGLDSIDVLMKAEKLSGSSNRFYKLDLKDTLKDNLHRKSVVEYPQLFVVIQSFYSSKTEAEKKVEQKQMSGIKKNDFLQLNNDVQKNVVDSIDTPSTNNVIEDSNTSDDDEDDEDKSSIAPILGYRDLIQS